MAILYPYLGKFRVQTENVQITVTRDEAREIIAGALQYMGMGVDGQIPADSLTWLNLRDSEPFTDEDKAQLDALEALSEAGERSADDIAVIKALTAKRDNTRSAI